MARPKIVISKSDHERLTQIATGLLERQPEIAEELLQELERARVMRRARPAVARASSDAA